MFNKRIMILTTILVFLLSLSAVGASDNITDDAVGLMDDDFQSKHLKSESYDDDILTNASEENVVTKDTFNNFFDEGILLDSVVFDELIFKGEFDRTSDKIIINKPISITGQNAVLKDMAIVINSSNVTVNGLQLNSTIVSGSLITVAKNNTNIINMVISYKASNCSAAAINVTNADNVKIKDNTIIFESLVETEDYLLHAIILENVRNSSIDGNIINAALPCLPTLFSNSSYLYRVSSSLRIESCENISVSNNHVETKINIISGSYPSLESVRVVDSNKILIDSNNFKLIDDQSKEGNVTYLDVVNLNNDTNMTILNNSFYLSTLSGNDASGSFNVLSADKIDLDFIGNNLSAISNGPTLGLYITDFYGNSSRINVSDNIINITGYSNSNITWSLVSGIEIGYGDARIYDNEIYTYNKAGYVDKARVYGVSYSQSHQGNRSLDIQNNSIQVQGDYTVYVLNGTHINVVYNKLHSENAYGDDSVSKGYEGVVRNNSNLLIPDIKVECRDVWIGSNANLTVNVANATGNVTIKVGNKTFNVMLVNGSATLIIDAGDLQTGINVLAITFNGDSNFTVRKLTYGLYVLDGIITNETFYHYFDRNNSNYLFDYVPENVTLDFRGKFIGSDYSLYINKPENIVSTNGDAVFDSGAVTDKKWLTFNIVNNANYTNLTGIRLINAIIIVTGASHVTLDTIYQLINMKSVGEGTGSICFRSGGEYGTLKNSYLENAGSGSSLIVAGFGAPYLTVDRNVMNITGSSGNIISANRYITGASGDLPEGMTVTNNYIFNNMSASSFCYGISIMGSNNLVENNTMHINGYGIVKAYGASSENNTYRNNTLTGSGSFLVAKGSIAENNNIEGDMTIEADSIVRNNAVGSLTIQGSNALVCENNIRGTVSFSKNAINTSFFNNTVRGLVTVYSDGNMIIDNFINSSSQYAIDIKSSKNNIIRGNTLYANMAGNSPININESNNNTLEDNLYGGTVLTVDVGNIKLGQNQTVMITLPVIATGEVKLSLFKGKNLISSTNLTLVNGLASQTISNLDLGLYEINIHYAGDSKFDETSRNSTFIVQPDVVISQNVVVGEDVNIMANFGNITDNIVIKIDGRIFDVAQIENGMLNYTFSTSNLAAGNHIVNLQYDGNLFDGMALTYFDETTGSYVPIEYGMYLKAKEVYIPPKLDSNDEGVLMLQLPDNAIGTIEVFVDDVKVMVVEIVNGIARIDLSAYNDGDYRFTFKYSGDDVYSNFTKELNVTVFHKVQKISAGNLKTIYGESKRYSVTLYGGDGKIVSGVAVIFKINGKQVGKYITSTKGIASYKVNKVPGTYKITVTSLGVSVTKTITVKHIVTLKSTTVKRSAKKLVLTATLAKINKKYLKGKKITFKFNGKKYTAKTNKKGVAKVTIKSSVLKKLKVGKKVTYQATYLKDTVKKTAKVKK